MSGGGHRPKAKRPIGCDITTGYLHTPSLLGSHGFSAVERRDYDDSMTLLIGVTDNQYRTRLLAWDRRKGSNWWYMDVELASSAATPQAIGGFVRRARAAMVAKRAAA